MGGWTDECGALFKEVFVENVQIFKSLFQEMPLAFLYSSSSSFDKFFILILKTALAYLAK